MSELDSWVTEYSVTGCGAPKHHIYTSVREFRLDPDLFYVGSRLTIDDSVYEVCDISEAIGADDGSWRLVYAHLVPQNMSEEDWYGLYGVNGD